MHFLIYILKKILEIFIWIAIEEVLEFFIKVVLEEYRKFIRTKTEVLWEVVLTKTG